MSVPLASSDEPSDPLELNMTRLNVGPADSEEDSSQTPTLPDKGAHRSPRRSLLETISKPKLPASPASGASQKERIDNLTQKFEAAQEYNERFSEALDHELQNQFGQIQSFERTIARNTHSQAKLADDQARLKSLMNQIMNRLDQRGQSIQNERQEKTRTPPLRQHQNRSLFRPFSPDSSSSASPQNQNQRQEFGIHPPRAEFNVQPSLSSVRQIEAPEVKFRYQDVGLFDPHLSEAYGKETIVTIINSDVYYRDV